MCVLCLCLCVCGGVCACLHRLAWVFQALGFKPLGSFAIRTGGERHGEEIPEEPPRVEPVLGNRTAPHAFSLFLKKVSGTLGRYKHRRIVGKTSFFRMDLLKAKFASLGRAARAEFDDGAADAMEAARASRLQALQGFRSRRAFAPAAAGSFSADSQVRATAASQQQSSIASAAAACSPGPLECPTAFYPEGSLAERPAAAAKATALAIDAHTGQRPAVAAALGSASVPGMPQVHGDAGGGTDPHPPALEAVAMWLRVDVPAVLPPSPAESPEAVAESGADASACPVIETDPGSSVQKKFEPDSGVLGAGVFGACRAVREVSSGERLCAKFALVRSVGDLARSNLRAEFAAMSRLNHPAVIQAFSLAFDSAGGLQAMLMPLMSSSLWAWLVAQPVPGAPVAAGQGLPLNSKSCLLQLASGLGHCHGRSIHHLDIKPENVLVDTSMDPEVRPLGFRQLRGGGCSGRLAVQRQGPCIPGELA